MNQELVDKAIERLKNGIAIITFVKMDGSGRRMVCTLNWKNIPAEFKPKGGSDRKIHEANISVFDLEKQAWRTIRKEFILKVE
jgi:hypothetical protein